MALPVRGLRPLRSARRLTRNVPKPPMVTRRPRLSESKTPSSRALSAFSAETLEPPEALAIAVTRSALTMALLTTRARQPKSRAHQRHRVQQALRRERPGEHPYVCAREKPRRLGVRASPGEEQEAVG